MPPQRPEPTTDHTDHITPPHLVRFANKIRLDLEKVARLYSGKKIRLFSVNSSSARCTVCTDAFTGAVLVTNCAVCGGTGYLTWYEAKGDYWTHVFIGPRQNVSGETGNTQNPGQRDQFVVIGAPMLKDSDLMVLIDTREVYKIIDAEPLFVAMGGEIITQVVGASFLTPGTKEYQLITW